MANSNSGCGCGCLFWILVGMLLSFLLFGCDTNDGTRSYGKLKQIYKNDRVYSIPGHNSKFIIVTDSTIRYAEATNWGDSNPTNDVEICKINEEK